MSYADLHVHSAYTFHEGTDLPEQLVKYAKEIGLSAIGILDVDGMYSAVQTAQAADKFQLPCVYGTELTLKDMRWEGTDFTAGSGLPSGTIGAPIRLPLLVSSQSGYYQLCSAISTHNLSQPQQQNFGWTLEEVAENSSGQWKILTGTERGVLRRTLSKNGYKSSQRLLEYLVDLFGRQNVVVEASLRYGDPPDLADQLFNLAQSLGLPLIATGASRCATPNRQALADVMTATRLGLSLAEAKPHLPAFGSFLRSEEEMLQIHRRHPQAVAAAADLAAECTFNLSLMKPELPNSTVPKGETENSWLRHLTYKGANARYGTRHESPQAWITIEYELKIIEKLGFPGYFLIVKDIVDFCRNENILCQGRGSAANSAVCYSLGITAVDAVKHRLMFERFLSEERSSAPDIDIDIEAQRREEVIQYVYSKYGRQNCAQVANTITYRSRAAIRDAGRALGYGEEVLRPWSRQLSRGWQTQKKDEDNAAGIPIPTLVKQVASELRGLPQHMGIHPGGVVLTRTPVSEICPVMWAAKDNRSVLQWDKEDCANAGLVKFDLLGLGMLTALRKCFTWLGNRGIVGEDGQPLGMYNLPAEASQVYELLCAGESVGIFQVESRAQMSTLPRMKPQKFYDLVIEVALIRPGPIQGQAVNPYLRRRNGHERVECHELLRPILEKTLGVPLFQEQIMRIAVEVAGFTPGEADELRRAIGSKYHKKRMKILHQRLYDGMSQRNIPQKYKEQIVESFKGFAEFGFPESHAFSFAYIVYASAWLKVFFPEYFYASILASQPMGFYSPASLLADAKKHGVAVAGTSVVFSEIAAAVETVDDVEEKCGPESMGMEGLPIRKMLRVDPQRKVRLGLNVIKGLSQSSMQRILTKRQEHDFTGLADFALRTNLSEKELELLAQAGAFADLGISRREALWSAGKVANPNEWQPFLPGTEIGEKTPGLPPLSSKEAVQIDYKSMSLTTGKHPVTFQRAELARRGVMLIGNLPDIESEKVVEIAGVLTHRQRPRTAGGITFLSLEDESGLVNIVCTPGVWQRYLQVAMTSSALVVKGRLEKKDGAFSIRAQKLESLALSVDTRSRNFC